MTLPTNPMRLRKLSRDKRLMLANLAAEKFRCHGLRAAEEKAHQHLAEILERDAHSTPKREIAVLEKYGYVRFVEGFRLPLDLYFRESGSRTFTRPDGVEVTRTGGETRHIRRPESDDLELPGRFSSWNRAIESAPNRIHAHDYRAEHSAITLKRAATLPGAGSTSADNVYFLGTQSSNKEAEQHGSKLRLDGIKPNFLSDDVLPALVAYYVAADTRICEERRLIAAAVKVIASCDLYGQVLDFWPEAAEIEEKLFEGVIPNAFSLVALSDDDKAALCRNMADRGVESAICQRAA